MKELTSSGIVHPLPPVFSAESRILILGSFPSVQSRADGFYYAHPQNRFWRTLAAVFGEETPRTETEKRALLLKRRVALWDVIASCEIKGSSDASICNVLPTDLSRILSTAQIGRIYLNGKTAERFYKKYQLKSVGIPYEVLPSTSAANAAWSQERLIQAWSRIQN